MDSGSDESRALAGMDADGLGGLGDLGEGADVTLSGNTTNPLLPGPDDGFEAQVDNIKSLVAEDPKRVAQVIKTWLMDE